MKRISETHYKILKELVSKNYWQYYIENLRSTNNSLNDTNALDRANELKKRLKKQIIESYANGQLIDIHYTILKEISLQNLDSKTNSRF